MNAKLEAVAEDMVASGGRRTVYEYGTEAGPVSRDAVCVAGVPGSDARFLKKRWVAAVGKDDCTLFTRDALQTQKEIWALYEKGLKPTYPADLWLIEGAEPELQMDLVDRFACDALMRHPDRVFPTEVEAKLGGDLKIVAAEYASDVKRLLLKITRISAWKVNRVMPGLVTVKIANVKAVLEMADELMEFSRKFGWLEFSPKTMASETRRTKELLL